MQELTQEQINWLVGASGFGVLALASEGDAYAIPINYARDGNAFLFHSRHGIKEDFIRDTRQACLVITRVDPPDNWRSVQVLGTIETLVGAAARSALARLRQELPLPPEWDPGTPGGRAADVFVWRLTPAKITGRKNLPSSA